MPDHFNEVTATFAAISAKIIALREALTDEQRKVYDNKIDELKAKYKSNVISLSEEQEKIVDLKFS